MEVFNHRLCVHQGEDAPAHHRVQLETPPNDVVGFGHLLEVQDNIYLLMDSSGGMRAKVPRQRNALDTSLRTKVRRKRLRARDWLNLYEDPWCVERHPYVETNCNVK